jgi:cellobiose phosphorylase
MTNGWFFVDGESTFQLPNPQHTSYLYFPLINEAGMISSITPTLNGDLKIDQNKFLLLPTSVEDLHNSRSVRNFWLRINNDQVWSVAGNCLHRTTDKFADIAEDVTLTAGLLWHKITREHKGLGLKSVITNFVPSGQDTVELMRVTVKNTGDRKITLMPTAAIPIYGRSADNLRDHRHVTSLLHRTKCIDSGVVVRPTLSFDERGHIENETVYAVLGVEEDGTKPVGFFPDIESFIGEGGTLDWPQAITGDGTQPKPAGTVVKGYEALGGICFDEVVLPPNQEKSFILILSISQGEVDFESLLMRYGSDARFSAELEKTKKYWLGKLSALQFETNDSQFDNWLKWVTLQPILRREIGNSFLPYHDYGRGGRGWRDLWQDILALLLMDHEDVGDMLLGYFAGVRMDGSNATIIGVKTGEFKADRNNIPRVWMDHGLWPLLTTYLYINQSGNLDFLLREQTYFKDRLCFRARQQDSNWDPKNDTLVKNEVGEIYRGSVLEHMLVQHLTAFFNVGEHNNILLEDADWNDALDMANEKGESVDFSNWSTPSLHR